MQQGLSFPLLTMLIHLSKTQREHGEHTGGGEPEREVRAKTSYSHNMS